MDLSVKVKRLNEAVDGICKDMRQGVQIRSMLESGNELIGKPLLGRQFDEAHGYNAVHWSLIAHLTIVVSRLYDIGKRPLAKQNKASVPVAILLLSDDNVIEHFASLARDWYPDSIHSQTNYDFVFSKASGLRDWWIRMEGDEEFQRWKNSLREFRDAYVAHRLIDCPSIELPQFRSLFGLLDTAVDVVKDLLLVVKGNDYDIASLRREADRQADVFWRPIAGLFVRSE